MLTKSLSVVFSAAIEKIPQPDETATHCHTQLHASSRAHQYVLLPSSILLEASLVIPAFFFVVVARCQSMVSEIASCLSRRSCYLRSQAVDRKDMRDKCDGAPLHAVGRNDYFIRLSCHG